MKKSWTIVDSYKTYKGKLEKNKYTKILKEIFWEINFNIIRNKYTLDLGSLGRILILRKEIPTENKRKKIDYNYLNKTGKTKYHTNIHTDGYYFIFAWKKRAMFANRYPFYRFRVCRGNDYIIGARGLASFIKESSVNPKLKDYTTLTAR